MIVILEGPDGGGKTTLAYALIGACLLQGVEWTCTKSPAGRSTGWDPLWDVHVKLREAHDFKNHHQVQILDRTPEISEPIYAFANHRPSRYRYPIRGWAEWSPNMVSPIFCLRSDVFGTHLDPWGYRVNQNLDTVRELYRYTAFMFTDLIPHTRIWQPGMDEPGADETEVEWRNLQIELAARNPALESRAVRGMEFFEVVNAGYEAMKGEPV